MRAIIILALIGAAFAARQSERIVGGEATTVENYPYIANMQYFWSGVTWTQFCGGTLITTRTLVSAAHCYVLDLPSQWRVRLGTSYASSGGFVFTVQQIIIHESYNQPRLDNDVSIIWLTSTVTLSTTIQTTSIAGPNYILPDNTLVTAIGWGAVSAGGSTAEQLQAANIYLVNQEVCTERYAYLKSQPGFGRWPDITDNMLCAGVLDVGGSDACQGDHGGPVVFSDILVGDVLVGIVSWGYGCADSYYPGVNARVSSLSEWIISNGQ